MNNENECGSAKHCNLMLPLRDDTSISDYSILNFPF